MIKSIILSKINFIFILSVLFHVQNCAVRVKRIIGGELYVSGKQDFLVALIGEKGYSWDILKIWGEHHKAHCTGSVINSKWIITAAHCFTAIKEIDTDPDINYDNDSFPLIDDDETDYDDDDYEDSIRKIRNGKPQILKKSPGGAVREIADFTNPDYWKARIAVKILEPTKKEKVLNILNKFLNKPTKTLYYEISKIIRHPMFDPLYLENDIALIKLKIPLNISQHSNIRIIPMTSKDHSNVLWPASGQICKAIGWGCKEPDGPIMNEPHSIYLPILKPDYCREIYNGYINLTDHHEFCAGYFSANKGICPGDSGGPLLCDEDGISVLSGIASATHTGFPNDYPGIYTRISYFKRWINDIMKHN